MLKDIQLPKGQESLHAQERADSPAPSHTVIISHPLPTFRGSSSLHVQHLRLDFNHQRATQDLSPERLQAKPVSQQTHLLTGMMPTYQ